MAELRAQPALGSVARVCTMTNGRDQRFRVPQVRLLNATVARRINRQLLRQCIHYIGGVDSMASPRQQLRQASLECCYDAESKMWMAGGTGYTGTDYQVLLNQGFLLSFAFGKDNNCLTEMEAEHLTFDLCTGKRLTLGDIVADPPAQLYRRFGAAIDRRLKDELAAVAALYGDSATIAYVAQLYGFDDWNTPVKQQFVADSNASAPWYKTADFALDTDVLLLFHNVQASRIDIPFVPSPI